jgi:hypothetical protein
VLSPGGLVPVAVLAGLLLVGLATRHRTAPQAQPERQLGPSVPAVPVQTDHPTPLVAFRTFDARGVFFQYPASWRPGRPTSLEAALVPAGANWTEVFSDGRGSLIAVAVYPSADPGTAAARLKRAAAVAREMADPSASIGTTQVRSPSAYPSFQYALDAFRPAGVGIVAFAPRLTYALGCTSPTSAPAGDAETRCRYVLDSFRDTSSGVSPATPTVRSAAQAVFDAWKAGTPAKAGDVATAGVLRYLVEFPWTPESTLTPCAPVPQSRDTFACTVRQAAGAGKLLVVTPVRGRFMVVAIGECSGDLTHGTCYILRSIGDSFP